MAKSAAALARHDATWFLRNCQDAPDDDVIEMANLLISELVTNAYNAMSAYDALAGQAPSAALDFSLRLFHDRLLIEVIDTSPNVPELNPPSDAEAESGRGLGLVDTLSGEWGYFWHKGRKVVYCVLPIAQDAAKADDE